MGASPAVATEPDYRAVVFDLGSEVYGIEIGFIREIIRQVPITALPGADQSVLGLISLRGQILPVVSLRALFGMPIANPSPSARIVVAELDRGRVGLAVDAVRAVRLLPSDALEPPPALGAGPAHVAGIARVDDGLVILLDLEAALARVDVDRHDA
jgi:purine-binding chemotaxis protein CheW